MDILVESTLYLRDTSGYSTDLLAEYKMFGIFLLVSDKFAVSY